MQMKIDASGALDVFFEAEIAPLLIWHQACEKRLPHTLLQLFSAAFSS